LPLPTVYVSRGVRDSEPKWILQVYFSPTAG
jgi:hypothetical protein